MGDKPYQLPVMSEQSSHSKDTSEKQAERDVCKTSDSVKDAGVIGDSRNQEVHQLAHTESHKDDQTLSRPEMIAIEQGETIAAYKARVDAILNNPLRIEGEVSGHDTGRESKSKSEEGDVKKALSDDRSPSHLNLRAISETDQALDPVLKLRDYILTLPPGTERDALEQLARQQERELLSPKVKELRESTDNEVGSQTIIASNIVPEVTVPLTETASPGETIESESEELLAWDGKQILRDLGEATLEKAGFFVHRGREDDFVDYKACQKAWQIAGLDELGLPKNIISAIMRNEQHFYKRTDEEQDAQVRKKGTVLSPGGKEDQNVSVGPAQIQIRNIKNLIAMTKLDGSMRYPFLEELRVDPIRKALSPEYAALLVAALLSDIHTEQKHNGIDKPSPQQIIYGYNPDVHSYSDKNGRHYIPILHRSDANAEKLIHKDLRSERYPLTPSITEASVHVRHVLTQLYLINEAHP